MVTMDGTPSLSQFIVFKLAAMAEKRSKRKEVKRARPWIQATIKLVLHIAGFSCLTIAAWSFSFIAGMAVAGISCFALSWLTNGASTVDDNSQSAIRNRG